MSEIIEDELTVEGVMADGELHRCGKCEFSTRWKSHYNIHLRTHSGERPYKCSLCSYSAGRRETLNRHMAVHSEAKPFICSKCEFSSKRRSDVVRHEKIHANYKGYKCRYTKCNYSTNRLSNLRAHLTKHYKEVAPTTSDVMKDDSGKNYLVVTLTAEEEMLVEKVFICQCGFTTGTSQSLKKHEKSHLVRLKCVECDYVTPNKKHFARHLKSHEFKYHCDECNYGTNYPGQFRMHQLTHTGASRMYRCSKCNYASYWKYEVKKHLKTHPLETETFDKYTELFEKYKDLIKPCIVEAERLALPFSGSPHRCSQFQDLKIEIVDASELPISKIEQGQDVDGTNFIVIRSRFDETERLNETKTCAGLRGDERNNDIIPTTNEIGCIFTNF